MFRRTGRILRNTIMLHLRDLGFLGIQRLLEITRSLKLLTIPKTLRMIGLRVCWHYGGLVTV